MTNKFKYYIPSISIEKANGENGEETYSFEGKAGGLERDYDKEIIMPSGADLSDFVVVNWQHRKDAESIIGEITEYSVDATTQDLMIKGILYPTSKMGKQVVDLMNVIKNDARNLKLGLSVEGTAIERNPDDKTIVTKSKLTGVAICTVPKNPATWVQMLQKGFSSDEEEEFDVDGNGNIADYVNTEGNRCVITKSYDIVITKAEKELLDEDKTNLAKEGKALPDGSHPIRDINDLKNAILSFDKSKDKGRVKRWIKKRAKDLNAENELPDKWDKAEVDNDEVKEDSKEEKAVMAGGETGAELHNKENTGASLKTESLDDDLKVQIAKSIVSLETEIKDYEEVIEKATEILKEKKEQYGKIEATLKEYGFSF